MADMMRQHPDIYGPPKKELHFFNLEENYRRGIDAYRSLFDGHNGEKAIGEFTPNYLWSCPNQDEISRLGVIPNIPKLIHDQFPDLKLIVSLRNPVDRAISAFMHFIRARSYAPFKRIHEVGHTNGIITMGHYRSNISEWLKYYPLEQFHFVVYEEGIRKNKLETLQGVFRFLEVDDSFVPENMDARVNARRGHLFLYMNYFSPLLARAFFKVFQPLKDVDYPLIKLTAEEKSRLKSHYESENKGLSELIQMPLPW
ncbi:Sulfotransferase domain superfamily [Verrucomicrobiia bacterium DG1235]|nr:Sulfotransferase domain superfamily [Verrucomicrobiae bacterium DG1235]